MATFVIKNNYKQYLDSLSYLSEYICLCSYNLKTVPDLKRFINLKYLDLSHNSIHKVENVPNSVIFIDLNYNILNDMNDFKSLTNLRYLWVNNNYIDKFQKINSLEGLEINNNYIESFKNCPPNISYLSCENNKIKSMKYIPESIQNLRIKNNEIEFYDIFS